MTALPAPADQVRLGWTWPERLVASAAVVGTLMSTSHLYAFAVDSGVYSPIEAAGLPLLVEVLMLALSRIALARTDRNERGGLAAFGFFALVAVAVAVNYARGNPDIVISDLGQAAEAVPAVLPPLSATLAYKVLQGERRARARHLAIAAAEQTLPVTSPEEVGPAGDAGDLPVEGGRAALADGRPPAAGEGRRPVAVASALALGQANGDGGHLPRGLRPEPSGHSDGNGRQMGDVRPEAPGHRDGDGPRPSAALSAVEGQRFGDGGHPEVTGAMPADARRPAPLGQPGRDGRQAQARPPSGAGVPAGGGVPASDGVPGGEAVGEPGGLPDDRGEESWARVAAVVAANPGVRLTKSWVAEATGIPRTTVRRLVAEHQPDWDRWAAQRERARSDDRDNASVDEAQL